jgi:hypothetical protein
MYKRLLGAWRAMRQDTRSIEAHLARLVELAEAGAGRDTAVAGRIELQTKLLEMVNLNLARLEYQLTLAHPRFESPLRLERFGRKWFSQFDEDGIIAEIFRRIGTESMVFVEIAAGDGRENCSVALLWQGWRGLWVECDPAKVRSIREKWPDELASGRLKLSEQYLKVDALNALIASSGLGDEIDLFIMDIDGNDYHMLEALEARPRVICTEFYAGAAPPVRWIMPRDENRGAGLELTPTSASLQALDDLLTPRGYSLVGSSIAGVNCFFVRSDLVEGKFQAPFTAHNHYNPPRYWYGNISPISNIWPAPDTPPSAK